MGKLEALIQASAYLGEDNCEAAKHTICSNYPFQAIHRESRKYSIQQMMEQFFRDGFIDRYTGDKLINPGILRVLSEKMPEEFPYHAHWKTDQSHAAYWEYQPTVDHIYPIALGGSDTEDNWATTSMLHNSIKSHYTLEQVGWTLKPAGSIENWDGLSAQFISIVESDLSLLKIQRIKNSYIVTKVLLEQYCK